MIVPAIRRMCAAGIKAEGPVAADSIFHSAALGGYGAVVAMFHDQGLGPMKTVGFKDGINLTVGLPFVRTSPSHGTAFDIAGKGRADPGSMVAAVRLACRLARRSNPFIQESGRKGRG